MATILFTHPACLTHDTGPFHPESANRLKDVLDSLEGPDFAPLLRREAPRADLAHLALAHESAMIEHVLAAIPAGGRQALDPDTIVSPGSGEAALRAAGAVVAAIDAVAGGEGTNAFCAVRPPGHHAEPDRAMGFCLFNNAAIGALHAHHAHGLEKVAIIDFDVHHGNGSQTICDRHPFLFYGSTHQYPFYPGTGAEGETGRFGNIVNLPLRQGAGSAVFRAAISDRLLPALSDFAPDLVVISAGFDAHGEDPLGGLRLTTEDFAWVTRELVRVAERSCEGRLVSTLEGGYDLPALAASAAAHVRVLMGR